jgi:hypothetical protein
MKKKVYQELASRLVALRNCNESGNEEWADKHEDRINEVVSGHLPSGSGIDSGNEFDLSRSTPDKLVIESGYHVMDENGFYNGWIDYMVIVEPSLQFGFTVSIRGKFGKRQDIKEYLEELYTNAIRQEI